jgi:outer membrane protein assembly factor BamB
LGPSGDSCSTETGILIDWPQGGPPVLWHRRLGASYGICSVSEGRLFQFDRHEGKARLSCLHPETGESIWTFQYASNYRDLYGYNPGPRCSPVVEGERVYIFGVEGMLHCLRTDDGSVVWKIDTQRKFGVVQNFFGVGSTPVIEGRRLIVVVGGSPPESQDIPPGQLDQVTGNGTGIVAFDKLSGEVVYAITDELASYASPKLATCDGRRWCFVFARGGLAAFDPTDGNVDFQYPWRARLLESVNASTPVVVGNEVLISETYGPGSSLLRVRPGGYDVVWRDDPRRRAKAMQCHWNTPIYRDGYLYGCSGRHTYNSDLRCIEWKTGKLMWRQEGLTRCSLLYVDGHFVCLGEDGTLRLLRATPERYDCVAQVKLRAAAADSDRDLRAGDPLLKYPAWAAPILTRGLLYVRGNDRLVCLDLRP